MAVFLLFLLAPEAGGWDAGGHMLIDEIAAKRLEPGVAIKIEALLPLLDSRFNEGHPYNLTTVGAWMDDMRGLGKQYTWGPWHYIDIPVGGNGAELVEPPPPHALWALDAALTLLRSEDASAPARAQALAQVIHLVGDIHQPLHTATRNDNGGTSYLIAPLVASNGSHHSKPVSLHWFWDGAYRFAAPDGTITELWSVPTQDERPAGPGADGVVAQQAARLFAKYPPQTLGDLTEAKARDPRVWVRESHTLACLHGWPDGPPPADYEATRLSPQFVQCAHEIAERQIVLAGYRLADLLNALFSESGPK
jgi:hypothetical protein